MDKKKMNKLLDEAYDEHINIPQPCMSLDLLIRIKDKLGLIKK